MVLVEVFYYFILYRNIIVLRIKNETVFGTRNVTMIMFQFHVSRLLSVTPVANGDRRRRERQGNIADEEGAEHGSVF